MTAPGGMAFPFRIEGGRVARRSGAAKIADDLRHLLSTRLGERVMLRGYGGGVHHRLQEPNDTTLRSLIRHEIEQALTTYLPDARLLTPIRLTTVDSELKVSFEYTVDSAAQQVELVLARQL